jgi:hypothetical protein
VLSGQERGLAGNGTSFRVDFEAVRREPSGNGRWMLRATNSAIAREMRSASLNKSSAPDQT